MPNCTLLVSSLSSLNAHDIERKQDESLGFMLVEALNNVFSLQIANYKSLPFFLILWLHFSYCCAIICQLQVKLVENFKNYVKNVKIGHSVFWQPNQYYHGSLTLFNVYTVLKIIKIITFTCWLFLFLYKLIIMGEHKSKITSGHPLLYETDEFLVLHLPLVWIARTRAYPNNS